MDKLTRQQEDIICKLLHCSRSEEVTQFILRTIGKENWTRDILSSCASELTEEQEDFQASVGYGYTSEELDEHFYIDDVNFAIAERLKEQHITKYIYENEELLNEIRLGNWDWGDDIDVQAIKREVSEDGRESVVLMDLHQRYDEVIDERGLYSVCKRGKWGFASYEGTEQIPPKYDLIIHSYEEEDAIVVGYAEGINFRMGLVCKQGVELIAPRYETFYYRTDQMAIVKLCGKWGVIDKYGSTIIPCIYDTISVKNERIITSLDGTESCFDLSGHKLDTTNKEGHS